MKTITVKEVEYIAFRLAKEILSYNEPIPDFSTRFPNVLESCLATPFQTFMGKSPYSSMISKASALFYFLIKNHPFQNGNKRIAMTALFVLLYKNGRWMDVDTKELYHFTMWIAESPARAKDETIKATEKFLAEYVRGLSTK